MDSHEGIIADYSGRQAIPHLLMPNIFFFFFFIYISYMLHTRSTCLFTEIVPDAHYAPPEGLLAAGLGASGGALQVALWTFQCALWQVRSQ